MDRPARSVARRAGAVAPQPRPQGDLQAAPRTAQPMPQRLSAGIDREGRAAGAVVARFLSVLARQRKQFVVWDSSVGTLQGSRSEERRVGKECRERWGG